MTKLEVDMKSIQKLISQRVQKVHKTLNQFENQAQKWLHQGRKTSEEGKKQFDRMMNDVQKTLKKSPWVKNFKKSNVYQIALQAKDELEKKMCETQERVFNLLNVPTKEDLDKLNKKIDELTSKLKSKSKKSSSDTPSTSATS
ncbi:MAG: phasin family protein [Deltaproteobacteria bacterium]|nr:phasin family protein [Deltaproteobacteria bacterium]